MSLLRNYFAHPTAVIDEGCEIGANTKIWHFCHIMPDCKIGENCSLGQNVVVMPKVVLGNNVKVQNNVSIYEGVICEDDVFLGPSMVFTNVYNPRAAISRKHEYRQILVRKGATIGANATIVCGNEIGAYAFIGAGSVVIRPVLAYALVVGNPARQIGWMSEHGERLEFDEDGIAICSGTGRKYRLLDKNGQDVVEAVEIVEEPNPKYSANRDRKSVNFGFEGLNVWKDAKNFVKYIYGVTTNFPKYELYGLVSQLNRAAISVPSNIAEGSARISGKEQARFTEIAYSSLMEVVNQIIIAEELNYISNIELREVKGKAKKIANQLNRLRAYQLNK